MRAVALILATLVVACRDAAIVSADGGAYCSGESVACISKACPNGYEIVVERAENGGGCGANVDVIRCKP